jgi:predicted PurR-regulated permease PerM
MENNNEINSNENYIQKAVGAALRISFIALMFIMSFMILKPFVMPVMWGIVFAVGIYPLHKKFTKLLGGKEKLSATLISLMGVSLIVIPAILFTASSIESVKKIANDINDGTLKIPAPSESVVDWPVVGKSIYRVWSMSANNISAVISEFSEQLKELVPKLTGAVASLGGSVLLFIIAIIIAGALLLFAESGKIASDKIFKVLVGEKGNNFSDLSVATIRSVVQGVIGIAVIQTVFLSLGMYLVDMPAAGVFSIIVLLVAIMQLPPALIMIPIIIYVFSYADTTPAIIFAIWSIAWSAADSFLKPMFLGKGVDIPMLVVLLGSIGGMMLAGPVGLFVGSVILALAYKIFIAMLED